MFTMEHVENAMLLVVAHLSSPRYHLGSTYVTTSNYPSPVLGN